MPRTIVVVGAGLGGLRVTEQLRTKGWEESIIVVGDEPHPLQPPAAHETGVARGRRPRDLYVRQRCLHRQRRMAAWAPCHSPELRVRRAHAR
jgi:3-phenylpropionate/trans-cinnamate dioxygenase ferredoxin reductase subunit